MSSKPGLLRRTLFSFWQVLPGLVLFEVGYRIFSSLVIRPLFLLLMENTFGQNGDGLAFNERILHALASPWGLVGILLLGTLATLAVAYEFSVIFVGIYCAGQGQSIMLRTAMELALPQLRAIKSWGAPGFTAYVLVLLPVLDMGLSPALLPTLKIPNFITGELEKTALGQVGVLLFYGVLFLLFAALLFVLPHMTLGGEHFGTAVRRSFADIRGTGPAGWALCGLFFAVWGMLFHCPGIVPSRFVGITGAGPAELMTSLVSGRLFSSLPAFLLSTLVRIALTLLFASLLTTLYLRAGGRGTLNMEALPAITARVDRTQRTALAVYDKGRQKLDSMWELVRRRPFYQRHRRLIKICAAALLAMLLLAIFAAPPALHAPIAIGHRGSKQGVENTLEAVQGAIDAGADFAEIDVLLSSDGVPMVIHDISLTRLAGDRRSVYELTAAELGALELSQNGMTGHISTLAEMLEYCRGKIDLVVELKTHGYETQDVAERVIEVVEEHDAAQCCIFMSIDYRLVERLNRLRPQYTIGYCVYGSITAVNANSLLDDGVDFLTIEENMVSPRFVNRCLRAGLPVYVWTVDDYENMSLYLKEGVSGIVSDYPELASDAVSKYGGEDAKDFFVWQNEWNAY